MYCRFFKNVSPLYLSDSKSQQMVHLLYVFSIHLSLSRLFDDGWCIVLNTFLYLLYNISTSNLKVSFQTARHFPNLIINPAMHNLYAYYTLNTTFWNSLSNLGNKLVHVMWLIQQDILFQNRWKPWFQNVAVIQTLH